jgi:hypothetical protein
MSQRGTCPSARCRRPEDFELIHQPFVANLLASVAARQFEIDLDSG